MNDQQRNEKEFFEVKVENLGSSIFVLLPFFALITILRSMPTTFSIVGVLKKGANFFSIGSIDDVHGIITFLALTPPLHKSKCSFGVFTV